REIAKLRLDNPDASLKELGTTLLPPIGKSGVNHRLRKLSMIAEHYREHKEENINDKEGNDN
ncbi:MAG: DNA-binding protein WhiA, partial [Clostridiales bacterium]|nr:DNA-binding protein WhiA [Clostridiales bacterium]